MVGDIFFQCKRIYMFLKVSVLKIGKPWRKMDRKCYMLSISRTLFRYANSKPANFNKNSKVTTSLRGITNSSNKSNTYLLKHRSPHFRREP